ncbi:hypothetical protein IT402_01080 [Candidatus Nomurabacteria bacterium]|nr:hypothetical protein [Candidatus Nomurabacteria bacterium]
MKYTKISPVLIALMVVAMAVPAYAFDIGIKTNLDTKIEKQDRGRDHDEDDKDHKEDDRDEDHFIFSSGIKTFVKKEDSHKKLEEKRSTYMGVITAKTDNSLTILSKDNKTYNVSLSSESQIWINKTKQSSLENLMTGDNVSVQGNLSENNISAKNIIVAHLPDGTVVGSITAKTDTSLTVLGTDNKTYTILTSDASIKAKGGSLDIGDSVIAKGDLTNLTLDAKIVTEEKLKGGFFHRFGLFFRGIFSKK